MDYDSIFNEIGHFGRWQQLIFFLGSLCCIGSSLICFMISFIAFTPDFRCFIPECDGDIEDAVYDASFTSFAIPRNQDEDAMDGPSHCMQYVYNTTSVGCSNENFFANITSVCNQHVYDDSQYKYPLTNELDLSPCKSSSDYWNLEVSICALSLFHPKSLT